MLLDPVKEVVMLDADGAADVSAVRQDDEQPSSPLSVKSMNSPRDLGAGTPDQREDEPAHLGHASPNNSVPLSSLQDVEDEGDDIVSRASTPEEDFLAGISSDVGGLSQQSSTKDNLIYNVADSDTTEDGNGDVWEEDVTTPDSGNDSNDDTTATATTDTTDTTTICSSTPPYPSPKILSQSQFKVLATCSIRAGPDLASAKVGEFKAGETINVVESSLISDGRIMLRTDTAAKSNRQVGWVKQETSKGRRLLSPIQPNSNIRLISPRRQH